MIRIALLDALTLGNLPEINTLNELGSLDIFETTDSSEVLERVKSFDILISNKVPIGKEVMDAAPRLKLICKAATGTNDVDLAYAKERGIQVKNVKDYSTHSVAQHTMALILFLLNKPSYFNEYVHSGKYAESKIFTHIGREFYELNGKKIGIIGLGAIGRQVARIAEAFGMEVLYYSTSGQNNDSWYQRLELDDLLSTSDIVSVHAPLNEKTQNLITYDKIKLMKKSSILCNTGRGGIIDEAGLARALNESLILGAGLDVLEHEPIRKNNPLYNVKDKGKLIITPHMAWTSLEARTTLIKRTYQNIKEFLEEVKK